MQCSIIIANYNGKHLLDTCLSSLTPQVANQECIIVVDNGSADGSVDYIRSNWPLVTTLPLDRNTGFTGANNAGSALSDSEIIVLLNNDTKVAQGWLNNLLRPFGDSSVGAVSSSMRRMGEPSIIDSAGGSLDYLGYAFDRGRGEKASEWGVADEILFPCGGAMAVRRSALEDKCTIFWDSLFLYNEDTDLGLRLWENGYRIVYQPDAVVEHALSATAGKTSSIRIRFCTRNRILVVRRHLGKDFHRIAPLLAIWEVMSLGFMLSTGQVQRFRASVHGLREAFTMKVVPLGTPETTRKLYARFMQPTSGTIVRKKIGLAVFNRIRPSNS